MTLSCSTRTDRVRGLLLRVFLASAAFGFLLVLPGVVHGATLGLSPDTGVYTAGGTFTTRVTVNTEGQSINAAEGSIAFNPSDLSVVSVSKGGSIFTLWTLEPEYSNTAGKISFGGGLTPPGYKGGSGTIVTVTFRAKHAGTTQVTYSSGNVLAADGKGTNVISGMRSASYTIQAVTETPPPEYVAPPNTPAVPQVTSETHPDQDGWYKEKTARLSWSLPSGVTSVRTLLDDAAGSIPTKVYETPIREIEIPDLDEGVSYFHIQFKNAEGWGRVAHYRLGVDSAKPESFTIALASDNDSARPEQKLAFSVKDGVSGVAHYLVQIDGGEKIRFEPERKNKKEILRETNDIYTTPQLLPGSHSLVVEAFDGAGNSIISSYDLAIEAFGAPTFTEYPKEMSAGVIPVIRGETRPHASIEVFIQKLGAEESSYKVTADAQGTFTFIPESALSLGVYELHAVATDETGARSDPSATIRIAVQESGLMRVGGMVVSVLSVIVPLLALLALLTVGSWYSWHRFGVLRRRVRKEAVEAEQSLAREFDAIVATLKQGVAELKSYRKGKLTKQEQELVDMLNKELEGAERRVKKEIEDIEKLVKR